MPMTRTEPIRVPLDRQATCRLSRSPMNTISIRLPKTDYTGGETISGSVELTIEEALPARGVRVQFRGMEQSRWTEGSGKHRHVHSEERVLFDEEQTLWGKPPLGLAGVLGDSAKGFFSAGHYEVLEPGAWSLPFTFVLPQELPGDYISMAKSTIAQKAFRGE